MIFQKWVKMTGVPYWRIFFVILGIIISFSGLILWNIPLNESGGSVNLYSDDSGGNFGEGVLPLTGGGLLMCFGLRPYIILSGLTGRPFPISEEAWNQKAPDLE